jgi:hypothetical protein
MPVIFYNNNMWHLRRNAAIKVKYAQETDQIIRSRFTAFHKVMQRHVNTLH